MQNKKCSCGFEATEFASGMASKNNKYSKEVV